MKAQAVEAVAAVLPTDEEQKRTELQVGDFEYLFAEEKLTWEQHETKAREWGGHIMSVMSKAENDLVLRVVLAAGHKEEIWLGGKHRDFKDEIVVTQEGMSGSQGTADFWKWMEGPWSYTNWAPGQPSGKPTGHTDDVDKNRLMMQGNGSWYDSPAGAEAAAVYKKMRWTTHTDDSIVPFMSPSTLPPFGISFQSVGDFAAHYSTNRARVNDGKYTPVGIMPADIEPTFIDSKRVYHGDFKDGEYHGIGTMEYETGDVYEGEWVNGQRHGKGIFSFADGVLAFDGIFDRGVPKKGLVSFGDDMNTCFPGEIKLGSRDWISSLRDAAYGDGDEDPGWLQIAKQREPVTDLYDDYPIHETNSSIMARVLDRPMWRNLHRRLTCNGITLQSCIAPGLDPKNTAHPLGLRASDPDCYTVFRELFDGVIGLLHADFDPHASIQPTDLEISDCSIIPAFAPVATEVFTSWGLKMDRSIGTLPCAVFIDLDSRRRVEQVVVSALLKMGEEDDALQGEYYPLEGSDSYPEKMGGMSPAETESLRGAGALFQEADCSDTRDWPDGRGVFITTDKTLVVHVNKEDHVSFFCQGFRGKDSMQIREMFQTISKALALVESAMIEDDELIFARSDNLGFLLPSVDKVGTGMHVEMTVDIPKLTKRNSIELMAAQTGLDIINMPIQSESKKAQLQSQFLLCVPHKLGVSETKILKHLIEGANQLAINEKSLVGGRRRLWLLEQAPKIVLIGVNEVLADDTTYARQLATEFGLQLITSAEAVQMEIKKDSKLGQKAKWYVDAGKPVPRDLVRDSMLDMLKTCQQQQTLGGQSQGWVCSGFPASPDEVQLLVDAEIKPNCMVSLVPTNAAVEKATSRLLSRRRDKVSKRLFYLEDEPAGRAGDASGSGGKVVQGAFPASPGAWLLSRHGENEQSEKLLEDRGNLASEAAHGYMAVYDKLRKSLAKLGHVDETVADAQTAKVVSDLIRAIDHNKQLVTTLSPHLVPPATAGSEGSLQMTRVASGGMIGGMMRPHTARGHGFERIASVDRPKTAKY